MSSLMMKELELIEQFRDLSLVSELTPDGVRLGMLKLTSNILVKKKRQRTSQRGLHSNQANSRIWIWMIWVVNLDLIKRKLMKMQR